MVKANAPLPRVGLALNGHPSLRSPQLSQEAPELQQLLRVVLQAALLDRLSGPLLTSAIVLISKHKALLKRLGIVVTKPLKLPKQFSCAGDGETPGRVC